MKSILCTIVSLMLMFPLFAQNADKSAKEDQVIKAQSTSTTQPLDANHLIKSMTPINTVEDNKIKLDSKPKESNNPRAYCKESEVQKIQAYINKLESKIDDNKNAQDNQVEADELKYLVEKLKIKLGSLQK